MAVPFLNALKETSLKTQWMGEFRDIAEAVAEDDQFGLLGIYFLWHHLNSDDFDESWLPDRSVLEAWAVGFVISKGLWLHQNYGHVNVQLAPRGE